mmetsp:Transcript_12231/g.31010  ORF Transcript_12231/g.31010 Transcript_12231/m.31010 type:complete len:420 (+) Transcript_12231:134-1393(+)
MVIVALSLGRGGGGGELHSVLGQGLGLVPGLGSSGGDGAEHTPFRVGLLKALSVLLDGERGALDWGEAHVDAAAGVEDGHDVLDDVHLNADDGHLRGVLSKVVSSRRHQRVEVDAKAQKGGHPDHRGFDLAGLVGFAHVLGAGGEPDQWDEGKGQEEGEGGVDNVDHRLHGLGVEGCRHGHAGHHRDAARHDGARPAGEVDLQEPVHHELAAVGCGDAAGLGGGDEGDAPHDLAPLHIEVVGEGRDAQAVRDGGASRLRGSPHVNGRQRGDGPVHHGRGKDRNEGIPQAEAHRLALVRVHWRGAPALERAGVQVEVVGHDHRADDLDDRLDGARVHLHRGHESAGQELPRVRWREVPLDEEDDRHDHHQGARGELDEVGALVQGGEEEHGGQKGQQHARVERDGAVEEVDRDGKADHLR